MSYTLKPNYKVDCPVLSQEGTSLNLEAETTYVPYLTNVLSDPGSPRCVALLQTQVVSVLAVLIARVDASHPSGAWNPSSSLEIVGF